MKTEFRILDGNKVFKKFELHYTSHENLAYLFLFFRKVYNKHIVQFEIDNFVMTASHTYIEEMARQKTIDAIDENSEWLAI